MTERVKAYPWAATTLGPIEQWPPSLRTIVGTVLGSKFPSCIVWGTGLVTIYNDAFRPILGAKPEALGRPFSEVWSEAWTTLRPIAERAFQGEATFIEDFPLMIDRNGGLEEAFFTFCYSPIRDEAGAVAGFLNTIVETTGKVLADRRQAFLLHLESELHTLSDPHEVTLAAAKSLGRHVGAARAGYGEIDEAGETVAVEQDWSSGSVASLAGEARLLDAFGPAVIAELRAGRTLVVEDCLTDVRTAAYAAAWASINTRALVVVPLLRVGRLTAILYVHECRARRWSGADVLLAEDTARRTWAAVERARAEAALRESEDRARTLLDAAPFSVIVIDPVTHAILDVNERACADYGYSRDEFLRLTIGDIDALGDPGAIRARGRAGAIRPGTQEFEARHRTKSGEVRDVLVRVRGVRLDGRHVSYGAHLDITERKITEGRQQFLVNELAHRTKNVLAVVQAALRLTPRDNAEAYARAVEGRVAALARAHTLLAEAQWAGAKLRSLAEAELAPFLHGAAAATGAVPVAELDGPSVVLPPAMAQGLAIALHELATNAVKYGALSVHTGRVSVSWDVSGGASGLLRLRWAETGGPPVTAPLRLGFGSRVLDGTVRMQLGGSVSLSWETTGLICDIAVPLVGEPGSVPLLP